jgi:hypothetical protein
MSRRIALFNGQLERGKFLWFRIKDVVGCFRALRLHRESGCSKLAQQMADHESTRTIGLYHRRSDEVSLE